MATGGTAVSGDGTARDPPRSVSNGNIKDSTPLGMLKKDKSNAKRRFTRTKAALYVQLGKEGSTRGEIVDSFDRCSEAFDDVITMCGRLQTVYSMSSDSDKEDAVLLETLSLEDDFHTVEVLFNEYMASRVTPKERSNKAIGSLDKTVEDLEKEIQAMGSEIEEMEKSMRDKAAKRNTPGKGKAKEKQSGQDDVKQPESGSALPQEEKKKFQFNLEAKPVERNEEKPKSPQPVSSTPLRGHQDQEWQFEQSSSHLTPFDPTRLLSRVSIPKFQGDKHNFISWKAAFMACVDVASISPEYKLLRLRESLTGEALKVIDGLGHSAAAYEAAKTRLERKYGGERRQIILRMEELERFRQVKDGNPKELEKFAELLDVLTVNLQDAHQESELGGGSLFITLQRKLSEAMLARFHRWVHDNRKERTVTTLREFVNEETEFAIDAAEAIHGLKKQSERKDSARPKSFVISQSAPPGKGLKCKVCNKGNHGPWACDDFKHQSIDQRWETAKAAKLCFRCLGGDGHRAERCNRTRVCGIEGCKQTHNRMLHRGSGARGSQQCRSEARSGQGGRSVEGSVKEEQNLATVTMTTSSNKEETESFISLRTLPVIVKYGRKRIKINCLLDDASTSTYVNASVAAELGVVGEVMETTVNVLNGAIRTFSTMPVEFGLESLNRDVNIQISAKTVEKVTGDLQAIDWNKYKEDYSHLRNIDFPKFGKRDAVDLLIGSDFSELHQSIRDVVGGIGEPVARQIKLGWTCIGPVVNTSSYNRERTNFAHAFFTQPAVLEEINSTLRQFWEVERVNKEKRPLPLSQEDQEVVEKTRNSLKYDTETNRYQVSTPWKDGEIPKMPDSRKMAEQRLLSIENKLMRSPDIAKSYNQVIQKHEEKGYIRRVPQEQLDKEKPNDKWYLPHFPIVRPDKATTKTRVVFDASAKVDGVCLNDRIHQGPKMQLELFDVLLRFRRKPVAVVCDISEMYLQLNLDPRDRSYYRFLYRDLDQSRPPTEYEFQRVVFGVNTSPFLAQFTVQEHARNHKEEFPMASETILKSTYMDDSLDSVEDDQQGCQLYQELDGLWRGAGMHPRKWLSNSQVVLATIPEEDQASEINLDEGHLPATKTLGVLWEAKEDVFSFKLSSPEERVIWTKRSLLRKIAAIFDPLGLVSPYIILGKIILQEIWVLGINWDEEIPTELENQASKWLAGISELSQVKVPRCLRLKESLMSQEVHTFGDASKDAYGAVVYIRTTYESGRVATRLVASKTKVAPLVSTSIPRLEMMAAVLGLHLTMSIIEVLEIPMKNVTFWSDSLNVLWWIRKPSRKMRPFIQNRVGEIQHNTEPSQWRYVPTKENPADLPSRGMMAADLVANNLWWNGPAFLLEDPSEWPENKVEQGSSIKTEMKKGESGFLTVDKSSTSSMNLADSRLEPTRYSSWTRLTRVQAWVNRFLQNCQSLPTERIRGELTAEEIQDASMLLIRYCQQQSFPEEVTALKHGREFPKSSKIASLTPKLDCDGVLRCDGRIRYAENLSYNSRHPIILPRKHPVTQLIVRFHHEKLGNHVAGTNQTLALLSARYWIVRGREEVKDCEAKCMLCQIKKTRIATQVMAPLPTTRVTQPARAFTVTSVDYAGPFLTKQGRGRIQTKRWLCLFTCHASRAVHLEMAYSMNTDSFLNAFNRFMHRRGVPLEMTSDNGTNFVGANRELMELVTQLDQDQVVRETSGQGIKWSFNPPLGPHFGGIHESLVKSAKRAIHAVLQKADITDEELSTAFTGAEALLNSRPLTYQSTDTRDEPPITPNHFLHGQCGGQFAPDIIDHTDFSPRRRWRVVQELLKHFWSRWMREWLPLLQQRHKWKEVKTDLECGDIVLVADPGSKRGSWPLGRITEVFPGRDGHKRVVRVQVGEKSMIRPIVRLCPLQC